MYFPPTLATDFRRRSKVFGVVVLLFINVSGCATIQDDTSGYVTRRYFGWLEVTHEAPQVVKPFDRGSSAVAGPLNGQIQRVKAFGLRMEKGLSLGYFDDSQLTLPQGCRLVLIVKDPAQIKALAELQPNLFKTEDLCIKPLDF